MKNSSSAREMLLLQNASLVRPDKVSEGASLLVEGSRIARIWEHATMVDVQVDKALELDGATVFPGFVDAHLHGAIGVDTMEADAEALHRVAAFLARNGVTAWLPTLVPAPAEDYNRAIKAIESLWRAQEEEELPPAARVLGFHYEGPFINTAQCGALRPAYFREFNNASDLDELAAATAAQLARMMTVAPEIKGGVELIEELVWRGWVVSIGHTRATVDVLERAFEAGAHHMTHFMNAMSPLHQRAPGPIGWGLLRDEVTCDVIADGVHVHPLMLSLLLRCKSSERVSLISDAVAPTGLGEGDFEVWGETITVSEGRTRNARGSIAGSVITMLDAVRLMLSLNVPAQNVARLSALNPARLLGVDKESGSIEEGKRADLVVLDDEKNVRLTLVGGCIAFNGLS